MKTIDETIFEFKTKADTQLSFGLSITALFCFIMIPFVSTMLHKEAIYPSSIPIIIILILNALSILALVLSYGASKNTVSLCQNGDKTIIKIKSFLTSYRYESPFTIQVCISSSRLPRDQNICYQLKIDDGQGNPMTFQERIKTDFDMDFFGLKYLQPKTKAIHSYLVVEEEYPDKVYELYNKIKGLTNSDIKDITEYSSNKKEGN